MIQNVKLLSSVPSFFALGVAASLSTHVAAQGVPVPQRDNRVEIRICVDAPYGVRQFLETALVRSLPQQCAVELGRSVPVNISVVDELPNQIVRQSAGVSDAALFDGDSAARRADKVLWVAVDDKSVTYKISVRDYDSVTRFLGPWIHRNVAQTSFVAAQTADALFTAFSPRREFVQIPGDADHVRLILPIASQLSRVAPAKQVHEGDILVPVLRRVRAWEKDSAVEAQVVPWTVLVAEEVDAERGDVVCRVISARKRPFGVRRRGRVEQFAVVVRPDPSPLRLQLQTRAEPPQPLAGCEALIRENSDDKGMRLAISDTRGHMLLAPTDQHVQTVWIKSGNELQAQLPIVWGLYDSLQLPLAEDNARIRAEADLMALRTELIDLVSRRSIAMARARAALANGDIDTAKRLGREIDEMPTRTQFDQRINNDASTATSADASVQARIDAIVSQTRAVLGKFLDPNDLTKLNSEIASAR